jgi:hypothetical protein
MEKIEVELLSAEVNAAIVRLPGRPFPGMVIQGDTLHSLLQDVLEIQEMAVGLGKTDLEYAISNLNDGLRHRVAVYEATLKKEGVPLPY